MMILTSDEADRLTFREWESLLLTLQDGLDIDIALHPQGYEGVADDIADTIADLYTEVIPEWL